MRWCRATCCILLAAAACLGCTFACTGDREGESLTLVSYNVQNLFDADSDGTEYPEFIPEDGVWDMSRYRLRVARLGEVIDKMIPEGADVVCLQEIEHLGVLEDLLAWSLRDRGFRYIAATEARNSAIQVGVISRVPISGIRSHQPAGGMGVRPILEVRLTTVSGDIVCLINHWKSKIGGAEETEAARIASADTLQRRAAEILKQESDTLLVCAGDLNECADESVRVSGKYPTALTLVPDQDDAALESRTGLLVTGSVGYLLEEGSRWGRGSLWLDPWLLEGDEVGGYWRDGPAGSHVYGGEWESIDHILCSRAGFDGAGWEFAEFRVIDDDRLLDDTGAPLGWSMQTLSGYADHLPIMIRFRMTD